jgi:hypothetical protein
MILEAAALAGASMLGRALVKYKADEKAKQEVRNLHIPSKAPFELRHAKCKNCGLPIVVYKDANKVELYLDSTGGRKCRSGEAHRA